MLTLDMPWRRRRLQQKKTPRQKQLRTGRLPGSSWSVRFPPGLQGQHDQRLTSFHLRTIRVGLCHQEIAVDDHQESLIGDMFFFRNRISRGLEFDITLTALGKAAVRWPVSWAMLLAGERR